MSKMHSSGLAKRVVRLQNISGEARFARSEDGVVHPRVPGPDLAHPNSLSGPVTTPADRGRIDPWSWMIASFIEGLALYGASFHGVAPFPIDPHRAKTAAAQSGEKSFLARRGHISLVSSSPGPGVGTPEFEDRTDPAAPRLENMSTTDGAAGRRGIASFELGRPNRWHWLTSCAGIVTAPWRHRRRERKIKKSVAALAGLDDQTLREMGIPHRSQIEQAVRYCHDC
jgi:hypothetical protein